jgi:hypothetical protein
VFGVGIISAIQVEKDPARMDVYKLSVTDIEAKKIDKDAFEDETFCRSPWYQDNAVGKRSQFAVCPACDNPIQLIGLYELPPNVKNPFGKHAVAEVPGLAATFPESREHCPYFNPRQPDRRERKTQFDGVPRKILILLTEQFDRVVYMLEKQTKLVFSKNALTGMLNRYRGETGYMYTGATLRNVPWIFAYMSDATDLFAQKVSGNEALVESIGSMNSEVRVDENGRVAAITIPDKKSPFIDMKMSFIRHRFRKDTEDAGLTETMVMVITIVRDRKIVEIHRETIEFDHAWFENLIRLPVDHMNRRPDLVDLARKTLGDLLQ